jgi:DNA-binding transcriptional MerR regulator
MFPATAMATAMTNPPAEKTIPDKLYFRIGEVGRICGIPTYVLRFWESEFSQIRPQRTPSGQRLYRKRDVRLILTIQHLLHQKKFTIEGARQYLRRQRRATAPAPEEAERYESSDGTLEQIRHELLDIRRLLT